MSFKIQRKTFKIGQSRAVTLPTGWCNYYGDRIATVTVIGHSLLVLAPQGLEDEASKIVDQIEQKGEQSK